MCKAGHARYGKSFTINLCKYLFWRVHTHTMVKIVSFKAVQAHMFRYTGEVRMLR